MSRRHRNVNILEYTMYSHGRGMLNDFSGYLFPDLLMIYH